MICQYLAHAGYVKGHFLAPAQQSSIFTRFSYQKTLENIEAYPEPCQTSKLELFTKKLKLVNYFRRKFLDA